MGSIGTVFDLTLSTTHRFRVVTSIPMTLKEAYENLLSDSNDIEEIIDEELIAINGIIISQSEIIE